MRDGTSGKVRVIGREVKTEPRAVSTQQQTRSLATELVLRKRDRVKQPEGHFCPTKMPLG